MSERSLPARQDASTRTREPLSGPPCSPNAGYLKGWWAEAGLTNAGAYHWLGVLAEYRTAVLGISRAASKSHDLSLIRKGRASQASPVPDGCSPNRSCIGKCPGRLRRRWSKLTTRSPTELYELESALPS